MTETGRLQHYSSGGLALLVHGLFFAALMFGVSWKNPPQLPVEADLWAALPEPPAPPPPEPLPEPTPVPVPASVVETRQADIALEKAEKRKLEIARRLEEKRLEEARRAELKRQADEDARIEKERVERERVEKERLEKERLDRERRDQARRQVEQELARQMQDDLDAEAAQLRAFQERARAGRQARVIADFKHRIQGKIQSYVRLPQKLVGNPEAVFQVSLLPNGEVSRVTLVKSSGQPAYDSEVERAILKASPLPLPGEKDAAAVFRDGLNLKFRPAEDRVGAN
jgi:colicin import membrane protein